jgi:hypothetical protein
VGIARGYAVDDLQGEKMNARYRDRTSVIGYLQREFGGSAQAYRFMSSIAARKHKATDAERFYRFKTDITPIYQP